MKMHLFAKCLKRKQLIKVQKQKQPKLIKLTNSQRNCVTFIFMV